MNKFDCLVNEMLLIRELTPSLNVQSDSIQAKLLFTFLTVKKLCPYLEIIKCVCKLMHFEHDDAENVATRRHIKTQLSVLLVSK